MAIAQSNRLLPLLAAAVLGLTVLVTVKSCTTSTNNDATLAGVPRAPSPDADTPADTIKTLTANVSAMTAEMAALRQGNVALTQENQSLLADRRQIEDSVTARLRQTLVGRDRAKDAQQQQEAAAVAALTARIDTLAQSVSEHTGRSSGDLSPRTGSDIPIGLGLDAFGQAPGAGMRWVEPLEMAFADQVDDRGLLSRWRADSGGVLDDARRQTGELVNAGKAEIQRPTPVYTVPRNATLIGSTAMTALVGRIPVNGQVRDPMPFKVITGKANLAANGLRIPGIQGMIWSGTAMGDWTLSCVSGTLESVTFVFDDGTIRTLSTNDAGANAAHTGNNRDRPLGWISDTRGIPCVTGERKTNAPAFLSQRMGVMALEAAAQAAAQAQTTTIVSDAGTSSSSVTGDVGRYTLGKTVSGGSQEVAKWLQERQAQSFDAVFVAAGAELAIHIDHELPIDYDHHGRKLHHASSLFNDPQRRLD